MKRARSGPTFTQVPVYVLIFCTRAIGLPPSAQLLGLCLLSTLEIIVRLHEKKPSTLPIADRTCLLQVLFRLFPQDIDAHAAIPRSLVGTFRRAIMAKCRTHLSVGQPRALVGSGLL
jgi:hypothetical protein